MKISLALLAAATLCGCATPSVTPVTSAAVQQGAAPSPERPRELKPICIVRNTRVVASEFLDWYRAALEQKGYAVTVVEKNPQPSQCPLMTRYTAQGTDLVWLEVYRDGKPAGRATSRQFYSEETVRQMVDKLFP